MCHGWRALFLPWKHLTLLRISRSVSLCSVAAQSHACCASRSVLLYKIMLLRISRSVSLCSVAAQSHAFAYLKVSVAAQHQAFSYLKVSERVRAVLL